MGISNNRKQKELMYDVVVLMKLLMFFIFLAIAIIRVKYNNSELVNYVNLVSCALAISTLIATLQTYYNRNTKKYSILIFFQLLNLLYFTIVILKEFTIKFIDAPWSDFFSIIALGISLSNNSLSRLLKCIFEYFELNSNLGLIIVLRKKFRRKRK